MPIPRPLCQCRVCREAREKSYPFRRTGPSLFLHDQNLLIDTPADIVAQLNREGIHTLKNIMFTHLDPDHTEGLRVIEQITLDFRTWRGRPEKKISLLLPRALMDRFYGITTVYGPWLEFLEKSGFVECRVFEGTLNLGDVAVTAIRVPESDPPVFIYVFVKQRQKIVYAPCDIKPFPEYRHEVRNPDLLLIQPGLFETGLVHNYRYPENHISRTTLYTLDETLALGRQLNAGRIVFVHLEEYWNRSFSDYRAMEKENLSFAYDGMSL
jgi:phosphoribosyl 1,2-cyclic phosphate phosphodiesterase